jgi:hypothetical protein
MTNAGGMDKLQLTLGIFAAFCIAALLVIDVFMGVG